MKFATREVINGSLKEILRSSKKQILIVTPYIKLHDEIKLELIKLETKHKVNVRILFGKNEDDKSKSLSLKDLQFLKKIPNIDIRFEETLHAKFYCNEKIGSITSMNLHTYSQKNNIECGVIFKSKDRVYKDAFAYFDKVFFDSEWYYSKIPVYKKVFFGIFKKYVKSDEIVNFSQPSKLISISDKQGYCIRTGLKIPLNHKMPYSYNSYKNWVKTSNKYFKENYCHYSGQKNDGKTSFEKPILLINWNEYQNKYSLSSFDKMTKF
jgi:hypothetical protein